LAFLKINGSVGQGKKWKYSLYPRLWAEELYCDIRGLQIRYSWKGW